MNRLDRLMGLLAHEEHQLFAVLDSARNERILPMLEQSEEPYETLYEGEQAEVVAEYGPFLVQLSPSSKLLPELLSQGWGDSWGIFLTSPRGYRAVRRHLRRFLLVSTEDGEELLFRFYDPRVLRVFIPICTGRQISDLFSDIGSFIMEDEEPERLLRYTADEGAVRREEVELLP